MGAGGGGTGTSLRCSVKQQIIIEYDKQHMNLTKIFLTFGDINWDTQIETF